MRVPKFKSHFDTTEFLKNSWQLSPRLLRDIVEFSDPLNAKELAELACEENVEGRLITGSANWALRHSPFKESDFTDLTDTAWTLLIQGADLFISELKALRDLFQFIPKWRFEDVMISYASAEGGVGPHFDYYDVFLVQGCGQRRWQLGKKCNKSSVSTSSGLMLLTDFEAEEEFLLNPGDVLYIPPGYAHWGKAESNSFCYSIGFRAPSTAEILEGFSDVLIAASDPSRRFTNSAQTTPKRLHEITALDLNIAYSLVQQDLSDLNTFTKWFGAFMTQPKYPEFFITVPDVTSFEKLQRGIQCKQINLSHNTASRFAFAQAPNRKCTYFFADGRVYPLYKTTSQIISELCESSHLLNELFVKDCLENELRDLFMDMLNEGSLLINSLD